MFPNLQNPYFYLSNVAKPPNINLPSTLNPPGLGNSPFTSSLNFSLRNPLFFQPQVIPPLWNSALHKYNQLMAQQRKAQEAVLRSLYYDVTQRNIMQRSGFAPRLKKFSPVQLRPVMGRPRLPCKVPAQLFQNRGFSESSSTSSSVSSKATSVDVSSGKLQKVKIVGRRTKQKQNTPCKCKVKTIIIIKNTNLFKIV